ncbi:MAG: hypothetical protein KDD40_01420 [Bdellovibrionales bacterium]|nr:hypothetical protein [Bdellovibrionales bacterium]
MKILINLLISIVVLHTNANASQLRTQPVFNSVNIVESDLETLMGAVKTNSLPDMLNDLLAYFPMLHIFVVPMALTSQLYFTSNQRLRWQDSKVSFQDSNWYKLFDMRRIADYRVGYFLAPFENFYTEEKLSDYPKYEFPRMIFKENVVKSSIIHEFLHFLIYRARLNIFSPVYNVGIIENSVRTIHQLYKKYNDFKKANNNIETDESLALNLEYRLKILEQITQFGEAEEVDVVNIILNNNDKFDLEKVYLINQINYLAENLQDLNKKLNQQAKSVNDLVDSIQNIEVSNSTRNKLLELQEKLAQAQKKCDEQMVYVMKWLDQLS